MSVFALFFLMAILNILFKSKHFIFILLSLEFIILLIYSMISFNFMQSAGHMNFNLYFLILGVCESVLGLGLLVYILRAEGNDYFFSFNLLF